MSVDRASSAGDFSTTSTESQTESAKFLPTSDCADQCPTLQCKYLELVREYEKEKVTRNEAEKAFYKMMELYEDKKKDFELFEGAIAKHREMVDMATKLKEQYCQLTQLAEDKTIQLTEANDMIYILKKNLAQDKRKMEQMKTELNFLKQPNRENHSMCDLLLMQERQDKEDAWEKMGEMCDEMKEIKCKSEQVKKMNKEIKEKMLEIAAIKNELVKQNETLLFQVDTMQDILANKDEQIEALVKTDIMENPAVQFKIEEIGKAHDCEIEEWRSKVDALNRDIELLDAEKRVREDEVEKRISDMEATCKNEHVLKEDYDKLEEKLTKELSTKERDLLSLLEAFKANRRELDGLKIASDKEIAKLKEAIRKKDMEIAVLTTAKRRYEELMDKVNSDKEDEAEENDEAKDESSDSNSQSVISLNL